MFPYVCVREDSKVHRFADMQVIFLATHQITKVDSLIVPL